jgi:hypothetical protein
MSGEVNGCYSVWFGVCVLHGSKLTANWWITPVGDPVILLLYTYTVIVFRPQPSLSPQKGVVFGLGEHIASG